jgi:hypothetical protein
MQPARTVCVGCRLVHGPRYGVDSAPAWESLAATMRWDGMGEQDQMQRPNVLALYEQRLLSLWERLVMALGIYTVRVLLERAIRQTAQRHPDIALIVHNSSLSFEALETRYATRPREEIEAAFNDLVAEMLVVLARLLGREMAQRLAEDFASTDVPNAGSSGTV